MPVPKQISVLKLIGYPVNSKKKSNISRIPLDLTRNRSSYLRVKVTYCAYYVLFGRF